jgi:Synergist-CTERM protein sorting domain-containing protein
VNGATVTTDYTQSFTVTVSIGIMTAYPQYFSNRDVAAARIPDIRASDLEVVGGRVVISGQVAETIAKGLLGANSNIEVDPLPLFEAAVQSGSIAAVKLPVSGARFGVSSPRNIQLLKVLSSSTGEFLRYAATEADYDDGRFTLLARGSETPYGGNINPGAEYDLLVFIRDGGKYDLDKVANGVVIDPLAIVRRVSAPPSGDGGDGGGGGCNAGYVAFVLLLLPFLAKRKK